MGVFWWVFFGLVGMGGCEGLGDEGEVTQDFLGVVVGVFDKVLVGVGAVVGVIRTREEVKDRSGVEPI